MKKVFVSFAFMAFALASCQGRHPPLSAHTAPIDSTISTAFQPAADQANGDVVGTYEGVLPGADGSVTTKITLNADGTYSKHEEFSKAGVEPMDENGTYKLEANGLVTLITPSSNLETYYKVAAGTLTLLDQTTKELPTGELAAQYVLNKK